MPRLIQCLLDSAALHDPTALHDRRIPDQPGESTWPQTLPELRVTIPVKYDTLKCRILQSAHQYYREKEENVVRKVRTSAKICTLRLAPVPLCRPGSALVQTPGLPTGRLLRLAPANYSDILSSFQYDFRR